MIFRKRLEGVTFRLPKQYTWGQWRKSTNLSPVNNMFYKKDLPLVRKHAIYRTLILCFVDISYWWASTWIEEWYQCFQVENKSYEYDIYLSYSEDDEKCVEQVVDALVKNKNTVRIFSSIQELDLESSWQTQLYDVIKKCKRVMALITPSFLQSVRCTEQYNIALCHGRKEQESILMPLYVTDVPFMPTYMRITQYIDCRYGCSQLYD